MKTYLILAISALALFLSSCDLDLSSPQISDVKVSETTVGQNKPFILGFKASDNNQLGSFSVKLDNTVIVENKLEGKEAIVQNLAIPTKGKTGKVVLEIEVVDSAGNHSKHQISNLEISGSPGVPDTGQGDAQFSVFPNPVYMGGEVVVLLSSKTQIAEAYLNYSYPGKSETANMQPEQNHLAYRLEVPEKSVKEYKIDFKASYVDAQGNINETNTVEVLAKKPEIPTNGKPMISDVGYDQRTSSDGNAFYASFNAADQSGLDRWELYLNGNLNRSGNIFGKTHSVSFQVDRTGIDGPYNLRLVVYNKTGSKSEHVQNNFSPHPVPRAVEFSTSSSNMFMGDPLTFTVTTTNKAESVTINFTTPNSVWNRAMKSNDGLIWKYTVNAPESAVNYDMKYNATVKGKYTMIESECCFQVRVSRR